jgi:threonine dehydratase
MATETTGPTLTEIEAARRGLAGVARVTPVYGSETLAQLTGRKVALKAENLQRTGSFKVRGAVTRIAALSEQQRAAGVVAASAGNHGQAVAWAARKAGIPAAIFVPQDAPMAKIEACRNYAATTELVGLAYADETGATFVHPYEDETVIAGQGTIGLELAEQVPQAETVLVPVGGGGLASGIALALRAVKPAIRVVGVEVRRDRYTIADGIAVKQPGELTSAILDDALDEMITVSDEEISEAIVLLLERSKLVVEGAGAVGVAALLAGRAGGSGPALVVLSGGNIDATMLISVMRHGLTVAGRYLVVRTHLADRPGELIKLLSLIAEERGNLIAVEHHREGMDVPVSATEVELTLVTRDEEHCLQLLAAMAECGYTVERLK